MSATLFGQCKTWFAEHVATYRARAHGDSAYVDRKERHTYRVLGYAREIVPEAGGGPELVEAIEIAALLHDVGRFPQVVGHGTYDDGESLNHAELGARIVRDEGVLDSMELHWREVILSAIHSHNVAVLPDQLSPDARRVLEVVRDADKTDALRNNLKYLKPDQPYGKALKAGLTWDDETISPAVADLALKRQLIPFADIKLSNDYILFLCCWLYDLHYHASFKLFKNTGCFECLVARLPDNEVGASIKRQLLEDLDWLIARSR